MSEALTLDELIDQLQAIRNKQQNGNYLVYTAGENLPGPVMEITLKMPQGTGAPYIEIS